MSVGSHGYGQTWDGKTVVLAHRVAYEREVGPIPKGMVIDHLCRTRACVNVEHMEVVTHGENIRRGYAVKAEPTVCRNGLHDLTVNNAYLMRPEGRRTCRLCRVATVERYKRTHK